MKVNYDKNEFLVRPFEAQEIHDVVFSMHPDKALSPDGMK